MIKKTLLLLIVLIPFTAISIAVGLQNIEKKAYDDSDLPSIINKDSVNLIYLDNRVKHPLTLGENLIFKLRYGFIKAGTATMSVLEEAESNGLRTLHIQTTAKSASGFNWVYKVRDVVKTFVRIPDFYPVHFEKILREGSYYADQYANFLPNDSLAVVESIRYDDDMNVKNREKKEIKTAPFIQDVLSAFYFVRTMDLEVGKPVFINTIEKYSVYDLKVIVHKRETIEVTAGKFRCLVIEPVLKEEGIFKNKGKLKIWLTDDDLKIPVQMKTEVVVGSITTELMKIEGIHKKIKAKLN
jgi:hypothetical protein